jgi:hypothetical protein
VAVKLVLLAGAEDRAARRVRTMDFAALQDADTAALDELDVVAFLVEAGDVGAVTANALFGQQDVRHRDVAELGLADEAAIAIGLGRLHVDMDVDIADCVAPRIVAVLLLVLVRVEDEVHGLLPPVAEAVAAPREPGYRPGAQGIATQPSH